MNPQPSQPPSPGGPASFYQAETLQTDHSVARLMRQILTATACQVSRELEPLGLTEAQWLPLIKLLHAEGSTSTELARKCRTDAGATTRMIDRLEEKGFMQRTRSETDRRVVQLTLTPQGRKTAQHIPAVLCDVQNELLSGFSPEEFEALRGYLRRMLDNSVAMSARRQRQQA